MRVLISTAKHVDVPSYETLFESTYGSFGFYFISVNMLIMAYGGCLSYLTIIKDTLPVLLGVQSGDVGMERAILVVSTMAIILPISMQRVSCCFMRVCGLWFVILFKKTHNNSMSKITTGYGRLGKDIKSKRPISMFNGIGSRYL